MTVFDTRELFRFAISGVIATGANLGIVWIARGFMSFRVALLFGIAAGIIVSFLLTKLLAFRSGKWRASGAEACRFFIVYCSGLIVYWIAADTSRAILQGTISPRMAETSGVLCGSALMMITGYFGHRFFTYRTHKDNP